jgi:hypothetical protein
MILDWEKWVPVFKKNIPVAILFFSIGCAVTYGIVYELVLESKDSRIGMLQTDLERDISESRKVNELQIQVTNLENQVRKLEVLNTNLQANIDQQGTEEDSENSQLEIASLTEEKAKLREANSTLIERVALLQNELDEPQENLQTSEFSQFENLSIANLLKVAESQLADKKYTTPAGDNAFETYKKIFVIDSNNIEAKNGIENITDIYIGLSEISANKGEIDRAKLFLARAKSVDKSSEAILILESFLNQIEIASKSNLPVPEDTATNDSRKIDIEYLTQVHTIAQSLRGLNLSSTLAAEFSEYWIENHSSIPTSKLSEIAFYAYSGVGMNLSSTAARDFVKLWFSEYFDVEFSKFKTLYNSAKSSGGLNLTTSAAINYAMENIRKIN